MVRGSKRLGQPEGQGQGEACLGCMWAWLGKCPFGELDTTVERIWVWGGNGAPQEDRSRGGLILILGLSKLRQRRLNFLVNITQLANAEKTLTIQTV